jgi:predicted RNA-binding protein YlqC (UPF0109 family)
MKSMILNIVRSIVDRPGDVSITTFQGEGTAIFELRCHAGDVGKIIGKDGKTVGALRTLTGVLAARQGRKCVLEVVE